jgi:hypothetical protein
MNELDILDQQIEALLRNGSKPHQMLTLLQLRSSAMQSVVKSNPGFIPTLLEKNRLWELLSGQFIEKLKSEMAAVREKQRKRSSIMHAYTAQPGLNNIICREV